MAAIYFGIGFIVMVFLVFGILHLSANGFFERFKKKK